MARALLRSDDLAIAVSLSSCRNVSIASIFPPFARRGVIAPLHHPERLRIESSWYGRAELTVATGSSAIRVWFPDIDQASPNPLNLLGVPAIMSLDSLRVLEICKPPTYPPDSWRELFTLMPSLTKLVLDRPRPSDLRALTSDNAAAPSSYSIPTLHTLVYLLHPEEPRAHRQVDLLAILLAGRHRDGHHIPVVVIGIPSSKLVPPHLLAGLENVGKSVDELRVEEYPVGGQDVPESCQAWFRESY